MAITEEQGEMLHGVPAIAKFLSMRERQASYLVDGGTNPAFRVGETIAPARRPYACGLTSRKRGRLPLEFLARRERVDADR
jgi:hypothetical protein